MQIICNQNICQLKVLSKKRQKRRTKYVDEISRINKEQLNYDGEVKAESNFKDDLGADSLDLFELVMSMEEEFGVEIPSEDLEKIATVGDVIDYLKAKGVEE